MKNLLTVLSLVIASSSFAAHTSLEPISVSSIVQTGDFMPPTTRKTPDSKISIVAWSNGCTNDKSFTIEVKQAKDVQFLTIKRTTPDHCRGVRRMEEIELKTDKLAAITNGASGGKDVVWNGVQVVNPVVFDDQTTH